MVTEAKVFRIGEIAEDLRKKVMDLEAQVTPSYLQRYWKKEGKQQQRL